MKTKKEYNQEYWAANKDSERARKKLYQQTHKASMAAYQKQYDCSLVGRFKRAQRIAKRRGLAWELNLDQYAELIALPCTYCTLPLNPSGAGLDRVDNRIGYLRSNVTPCCPDCNFTRGDMWTYEEMLVIGVVLKQLKEARQK